MAETRKIPAILVADIVGYSRLAGADEDRTLSRLRALRSDLLYPAVAANRGRIVKWTGDGALIEFRSVVDAVSCALEVQNGMAERNAGLPPERRIDFRIGIHLGDVVEEADGDLMGDGVNVAARLEGVCEPGGQCARAGACKICERPHATRARRRLAGERGGSAGQSNRRTAAAARSGFAFPAAGGAVRAGSCVLRDALGVSQKRPRLSPAFFRVTGRAATEAYAAAAARSGAPR
jgi:hypothetical protein